MELPKRDIDAKAFAWDKEELFIAQEEGSDFVSLLILPCLTSLKSDHSRILQAFISEIQIDKSDLESW